MARFRSRPSSRWAWESPSPRRRRRRRWLCSPLVLFVSAVASVLIAWPDMSPSSSSSFFPPTANAMITPSRWSSRVKRGGTTTFVPWMILPVRATLSFHQSLEMPRQMPPRSHAASLSSSRLSPLLRAYQPFTQVISDVDDTLKSSGGVNVAGVALGGIDVQYKRGDFYPGVFQFMLELSLYSVDRYEAYSGSDSDSDSDGDDGNGGNDSPKIFPAKVAVLTARAEEFKAALELKEDSKLAVAFRKAGERAGYDGWGLGPVLYGSVAEWVIQDRKGMRKFSNFERLIEQDPSGTIMQYIYVGDTGELDQEAGETMLREYPEVVKAVFLHVVSDRPDPIIPPPKLINGRPVVFFRTYVGAAARAAQLGLMDEDGMMRVVAAAEESLANVGRESEKWADLDRDIVMALRTMNAP